jgi:hypothetical protein
MEINSTFQFFLNKIGRSMKKHVLVLIVFAAILVAGLCSTFIRADTSKTDDLAGAWRGKVQIMSGVYAAIKDLEFMYAFNMGGTMTESSNYDAAPPGPPAYGVWRKTGTRQYEAKYLVFQTKAVSILDEITKGSGWAPDGYGVLSEKIFLSENGDSFESKIKFEIFDQQGKITTRGGEGVSKGKRITF